MLKMKIDNEKKQQTCDHFQTKLLNSYFTSFLVMFY